MPQLLTIFMNKQFQNIAISHLNTTIGMNFLIPVLPVFLQSRGFTETQIGLIMGITAASALLVRPWAGAQVDTKGGRPVILFGQLLLFISTTGYLWASSFAAFFGLRMLFGVALAFYGTAAVTFASSIGTGTENSNSIAMYTLTTMLGIGLSMSLAQTTFDWLGFQAIIVFSMVLIASAFSVMKFRSEPLTLGTRAESRASFMTVLKLKIVFGATVCQFGANFCFGAVFAYIPLASLAYGIHFYSLFFMAFAIFVVVSRFCTQQVNAIFGMEKAAIYASLTMLAGILLLAFKISAVTLVVAGVLFGLGFGVVFPTLVLILVSRIDPNNRGTALAILTAAGDVGNALSMALLGGVAEHFGYIALFTVTAAILACCIFSYQQMLPDAGADKER